MSKKYCLFLTACICIFLAGCGNDVAFEDAEQYTDAIEDIVIPDDVRIIGFGEATHGNSEFQKLKKDVFEALIKNENVRVFVLEGDFGGAQQKLISSF